jgi:single-strand DNA-binding protein
VIFSEPLCKVVEQYVKKGMKLYIEGQLQTRKWQDQSGAEKYSTEVVLQGFSGTLQMLDRGPGGGMQDGAQVGYDAGGGDMGGGGGYGGGGASNYERKEAQPVRSGGGGAGGGRSGGGGQGGGNFGGGGGGGFDKELDDEVPF